MDALLHYTQITCHCMQGLESHPYVSFSKNLKMGFSIINVSILNCIYKRGSDKSNANGSSCIPLPTASQNITLPREYVLLLDHLSSGPITATHIKNMTRQDKVLFRVLFFVQKGGLPLLIRF